MENILPSLSSLICVVRHISQLNFFLTIKPNFVFFGFSRRDMYIHVHVYEEGHHSIV